MTARDVPAIIALALAVGALACAYMSQESFVYFWDYSNFHGIAVRFADALMADPRAGAAMFVDALAQEYNLIFALPLLPVIALTDGSRLAYIVALAVLYLVPFALVARRGLPSRLSAIGAGGAVDRHAAGYRRAAGLDRR